MNFLKSFLASFLAVVAAILIGLPLLFVFLAGIAASFSSTPEVSVPSQSVLEMKLNGPIVENASPESTPFNLDDLSGLGLSFNRLGLYQILASIEKAQADDRIEGIYLNLGPALATGWANVKSIRDALTEFQDEGKFIYAYGEVYNEKTYYLASVADSIFMAPQGVMEFDGLVNSPIFYKGLFDKVDLEPRIFRVGTYKSAVEPFLRKDMSEASKEQTRAYLGDIWGTFLSEVAEGRGMDRSSLDRLANEFVFGDGEAAAQVGLVDRLVYEDDVLARLSKKSGRSEDSQPKLLKLTKYLKVKDPNLKPSNNRVAVVFAEGNIQSGKSTNGVIGSETIIKELRKARKDDKVKAIVFRINSPGGSALASDVIAEEVRLCSEAKPIVASFGDVAASGGYYIGAKCDRIFAQPNTITGSIGIFAILFDAQATMNNQLGLTFDEVETNRSANFANPFFPMTEAEQRLMQSYVERGYGNFLDVVREGRDFSDSAAVDQIAQGRVWSGRAGLDINLVDEMGDLDEAVAYAAEQAGLGEDYMLRLMPKPQSPIEKLMQNMTEAALSENVPMYDEMQDLERIKRSIPRSGLYMLMTQDTDIH